jgi:hypothetical protein
MTSCRSSSLSRIKRKPAERNGSNPAPQRRSDCDRLLVPGRKTEDGKPVEASERRRDCLESTCNQRYGGDIIDPIMLCAGVTGVSRTVARAARAVNFNAMASRLVW